MGLTVNYDIQAKGKSDSEKVRKLVEKMRQIAMNLPFQEVQDIVEIAFEKKKDARMYMKLPWSVHKKDSIGTSYTEVLPVGGFMFSIVVGDGSEWMDVGLAIYPKEIEAEYSAEHDAKFRLIIKDGGSTRFEFDHEGHRRYRRNRKARGLPFLYYGQREMRKIKVPGRGPRFGSFCKTQYASDPACGGLKNFLKCHLSVVRLLRRISEIPGVSVTIDDEGHYETAKYSDDYRKAYAAGKTPTYVWHPATNSIKELAKQVGHYNELVASMLGTLGAAAEKHGVTVEAPIKSYSNFEQLAAGNADAEATDLFLATLKQ